MSKPMSELERVAKLYATGIKSEFGQRHLTWLTLLYNQLHQEAEGDLTAEQKAFRVERAAGVKQVIDYLMTQQELIESGYDFDQLK
jgi:hypothetical protein